MVSFNVKTRSIGATAQLGPTGEPTLVSDTGGSAPIATSVSGAGFNPMDLMFGALATCLVLSARIAAKKLGWWERIEDIRVHVTGTKAESYPSRIETFQIRFEIDGGLSDPERHQLIEEAEAICTVSNTMKTPPGFEVVE
ncbi:OsmC family protein [Lacibacterium aquatile]|uniref:OsmC family protein n=1 Tax=Lacibacterium aquatile TaxID=1168082 RepID=A0ABW5DM86_9PROT